MWRSIDTPVCLSQLWHFWLAVVVLQLTSTLSSAQNVGEPRKLAPRVLTVIPVEPEEAETVSGPRAVVEVVRGIADLEWNPHFSPESVTLREIAKRTIYRRTIWNLEFSFKPLRMIRVDIPQSNGRMRRKLIWYLVYRVRNSGGHLEPVAKEDDFGNRTFDPEPVDYGLHFFPHFVLETKTQKKAYLDQLIPIAIEPIQQREDPNTKLYNTVSIGEVDLKPNNDPNDHGVWGVATWQDIDPRIDFFSIYVQGLTNAYQFEDPEGAFSEGDPPGTGRKYTLKTLQLNFWRPGDSIQEHEDEIRFGVPVETDSDRQKDVLSQYGLQKRLDYLWLYR